MTKKKKPAKQELEGPPVVISLKESFARRVMNEMGIKRMCGNLCEDNSLDILGLVVVQEMLKRKEKKD